MFSMIIIIFYIILLNVGCINCCIRGKEFKREILNSNVLIKYWSIKYYFYVNVKEIMFIEIDE